MKNKNSLIVLICFLIINCKGQQEENAKKHTISNKSGNEYIEKKDNSQTLQDLSKPKEISNEAANLFNQGIQILQKRGFFLSTKKDTQNYLKAASYIKKAIEHDRNYVNAYINLAKIYYKINHDSLALDVLNNLLEIKPKHVEAITTKGFILEKINKKDEANIQYKIALQIYSFRLNKTYSDHINRAFLTLLLYGEKEGIKELERIKEKYPNKKIDGYINQFRNFNREAFIKNALN
jgi:tetratricopeptide (TPR) repeat protein